MKAEYLSSLVACLESFGPFAAASERGRMAFNAPLPWLLHLPAEQASVLACRTDCKRGVAEAEVIALEMPAFRRWDPCLVCVHAGTTQAAPEVGLKWIVVCNPKTRWNWWSGECFKPAFPQ